MTDSPEDPQGSNPSNVHSLQGVETGPSTDPASIVGEAEQKLIERARAAASVQKTWTFRGEHYRLRAVLPAKLLETIGAVQSRQDYGAIVRMFLDLFHKDDRPRVQALIDDVDQEVPLDLDFLTDSLNEIIEKVSGRPLAKS